jgi:hypothetical protein
MDPDPTGQWITGQPDPDPTGQGITGQPDLDPDPDPQHWRCQRHRRLKSPAYISLPTPKN